MKTPQELAALAGLDRITYVVSNVSVAMDQACIEGKITEQGGVFEALALLPSDWDVIKKHFENYRWHPVLTYDPIAEKYIIKISPDISIR